MRRAPLIIAALCAVACSKPLNDLGEPCGLSSDCVAGLSCRGPAGATTCRMPGVAGEPCWSKDSTGCESGFVCSHGTCIVPGTRAPGEACSYNVDCAAATICNWSVSPYACTRPALVGEACQHDTDCASGLVCPNLVVGNRTCDCAPCAAGLACGGDGCVAPGSVALGKPCGHNSDCQPSLVCVWAEVPYVCQPPRQIGELCGHPTDCAEGLGCGNDATCRPLCDSDAACTGGDICLGVCQPPSPKGGACASPGDCVPGLVCNGQKTCAEPIEQGQKCSHSDDCRPELWCDSVCTPDLGPGAPCSLGIGSNEACLSPLTCVVPCYLATGKFAGNCLARIAKDAACTPCEVTEEQAAQCKATPLLCDAGCEVGLVCADHEGVSACVPQAP